MAVIQTLRNKAGVLVAAVIGLALLAFILGEFLTSGSKTIRSSQTNVAVINGKSISIDKFQSKINEQEELAKMQMGVNTLDEQTIQDIRKRAWDDMVQAEVLDREFDKLGLAVSGDELYDMVNGEKPHPFIMQFFADPNTGVINRLALGQFLQNVNDLEDGNSQKMFWFYLEDLIFKERKSAKYNTLLRQGLYATKLETSRRNSEMNTSVNFSYVVKRYNEIPDSLVQVTDTDIKNYYKEHKNEFKQEKSRDISYVVWEVVPSEKDFANAEAWINEVKPELEGIDAKNTDQYVKANSDIAPTGINYAKGELDARLDEFAFSSNLGDVYGPYFEDNYYKLAKLSKINLIPDSVKVSHIMLAADQNSDIEAIQKLADSLKTELTKGANFASLASVYSDDKENSNGNLGWFKEGNLPQPFTGMKSISDSCFYGKTGDVKIVYTQYGLHIIKVTAQSRPVKKVQVSVLAREVRISEETDQTYFAKASEFGAINNTQAKFTQAISEGKVKAQSFPNLQDDANSIPGLDKSRQLVRWAYENEEGSVSKRVMQFGNKYVVALLSKVREEGFASIEDVKNTIEIEVRKQKQGEQLIAKINEARKNATDINSLATNLNLTAASASNVRFSSYSIPNLGVEPKLQSVAISLEEGKLSPVIEGNNGVYVLQVDSKDAPAESADYSTQKNLINRAYASRVNYTSMKVLNDLAGVEDNRINFF